MTLMTLSMCAGVDMRFRGRFQPTPAGALVVQRTGQGKAMGGKRHRLAPSAGRTARAVGAWPGCRTNAAAVEYPRDLAAVLPVPA